MSDAAQVNLSVGGVIGGEFGPDSILPNGPGMNQPVTGWYGDSITGGDYMIDLRGACFVPTPGAAMLLGLGGGGGDVSAAVRR